MMSEHLFLRFSLFLVLFSSDSFKYKVPYNWGRTSLYEIKTAMDLH